MRNNRFLLLSLLLIFSANINLSAQDKISLENAVNEKKIKIAIRGKGGYRGECLKIAIINLINKELEITIPAGQTFASEDTTIQDLMVTQEEQFVIAGNTKKYVDLLTMCIQSFNGSPYPQAVYSLGAMANGPLLDLAKTISENGYQNSTAQSAVWSIANNDAIRQIYGNDTTMVRQLATHVSEATGTPMSEFEFTPRTHHITNIHTSFETYFDDYTDNLSLGLYDEEGNVIRTYFDRRSYEPGFFQWKVGAFHTLGDSTPVYIRLFQDGEMIAEKRTIFGDTTTKVKELDNEVIMHYEVAQNEKARIAIFDDEDRLCFLLADQHPVKAGAHRSRFRAKTYLLPDHEYKMKILVDGEVIASEKIDLNAPPPVMHEKLREKGEFTIKLEEAVDKVQLAIYDQNGKLVRIMYDIHHLNPGKRKFTYAFQHLEGPDAIFYAKLTDKDGEVIWEKRLN
jgi:hypothetical protein